MTADLLDHQRTVVGGEYPLRYLAFPGTEGSGELLLVFSGFDRPFAYRYNYVRSLARAGQHRRYLLDDLGPRGCYYLGARRNFLVERAIASMVDRELDGLGLGRKAVTAVGSSKGASAALYFGLRHGYGHVVAGGPQTAIGDYLTKEVRGHDVASLIAGGATAADVEFLNGLLPAAAREAETAPHVTFFTSEGDRHWARHLEPFLPHLDEAGVAFELVWDTYTPHSAIGQAFGAFLASRFAGEEG